MTDYILEINRAIDDVRDAERFSLAAERARRELWSLIEEYASEHYELGVTSGADA